MDSSTKDLHSPLTVPLAAEILFSLTLAASFLFGGLFYVLKNSADHPPVNDSTYLSLRSAYRIADLLKLHSSSPVGISTVRREMPPGSEGIAFEILIVVTVCGLAALIASQLRPFSHSPLFPRIFRPLWLFSSVFAAPAAFLVVSWVTWDWEGIPGVPRRSFPEDSLPLNVFLVELVGFCVTFSLRRLRARSGWVIILALHHAFWSYVLWSQTRTWLTSLYVRDFLLLLFPLSTFLWFRSLKRSPVPPASHFAKALVLPSALASLVLAAAVWRPARNVTLAPPRDPNSLVLELGRGPWFGSCPAYSFTVHGDGRVEFDGQDNPHPRTGTKKSGSISADKIQELLRTLDDAHFLALDDRAFYWAFDTPSIGIRVAVDGRTKEAVSDDFEIGSPSGRQARFVTAARQIDFILKSTRWTRCSGECPSPSDSE